MVYNKILINSNFKNYSKNTDLIKNKIVDSSDYGFIRSKNGKIYKVPSICLKNKKPGQNVAIKIHNPSGLPAESDLAVILSISTNESNKILNSKNKFINSSVPLSSNNLTNKLTNNSSSESSTKLSDNLNNLSTVSTNKLKDNSPIISSSKLPNDSIKISTIRSPNNPITISKSKSQNNQPDKQLSTNPASIIITTSNKSYNLPILKEKSMNISTNSISDSSTISSDEINDVPINNENLDINHNRFNSKENQIKFNSQFNKVSVINNSFETNYNNLQNSLSLELKFKTRDYLISILNKFSNILNNNNQNLSQLTINELRNENSNLITILSNLKLISTHQSNNQILNLNSNFLELKFDQRFEIIQLLIKNSDFLQMNNQIRKNEIKRNLLNDNNLLIQNLLDLSNNVKDIVYDNDEDDDDQSIDIRKQIDLLKANKEWINKYLEKSKLEYNNLETKIMEIKNELNSRSEIEFEYVIDNVSNLLNSVNESKSSEVFYCRNVPFILGVLVLEKNIGNQQIKVMEFFIKCKLKEEEVKDINWSFGSSFFFTLFSNMPNNNKIISVPNIEFSNSKRLIISNNFIKLQDLIDPSNNFIKNDQLVIGFKIGCERMIIN